MMYYIEVVRLMLAGKLAEETGFAWDVTWAGGGGRNGVTERFAARAASVLLPESVHGFECCFEVGCRSLGEFIETGVPQVFKAVEEWREWRAKQEAPKDRSATYKPLDGHDCNFLGSEEGPCWGPVQDDFILFTGGMTINYYCRGHVKGRAWKYEEEV